MTKEIIVTGKTIDAAVEAGCAQLSVSRDNVQVEVIEAPSKSLFGLKTTEAKVKLILDITAADKAADFIGDVLGKMGLEATINVSRAEEGLFVELEGPDMGIVIGRRGETLDALQYLTSLVVNREEEDYIKVTVDTENYRQKREDTLVRLARKLAAKVVKYHKNMTLEPMNPYERRIIHATLQDFDGVTTYSVGNEPARKVVIAVEGSKAPAESAPRDSRNSRGGKNRRGGRSQKSGERQRTERAPQEEEQKAPLSSTDADQSMKSEEPVSELGFSPISDKELWEKMFGSNS